MPEKGPEKKGELREEIANTQPSENMVARVDQANSFSIVPELREQKGFVRQRRRRNLPDVEVPALRKPMNAQAGKTASPGSSKTQQPDTKT